MPTITSRSITKDCYIDETATTTPQGADDELNIVIAKGGGLGGGNKIGVMEVSLSGIPQGAYISSITYTVNVTAITGSGQMAQMSEMVHSDWVEEEATWKDKSLGVGWGDDGMEGITDYISESNRPQIDLTSTGMKTSESMHIQANRSLHAGKGYFGFRVGSKTLSSSATFDSSEDSGGTPPTVDITWTSNGRETEVARGRGR